MRRFFSIAFLLFSLNLRAQDFPVSTEKDVIVTAVHWVLKNSDEDKGAGVTREASLYKAFRIRENDIFRSPEHLIRRLDRGKKELEDRHIFSFIDYSIVYSDSEDYLEAEIFVYIEDRWTIYVYPIAAFDYNDGIIYGGKLKYKNVLGTLIDLELYGFWSEQQWRIVTELSNVDLAFFQGNLYYTHQYEQVYQYDNDENLQARYSYQISDLQFKIDIPIYPGMEYYIMPGLITTHSFMMLENLQSINEAGLKDSSTFIGLDFTHGYSYDRVFWFGNMRSGFSLSMDNRIEIPIKDEYPQADLDFSINGYAHFGDTLGLSGSLSAFKIFNGVRNNAGNRLRGIENHLAYGGWGVYFNSNIESRTIYIPKLLEIHLQSFMDVGFMKSPGEDFGEWDNMFVSAGMSAVIFPLPIESVQLSVILGYDMIEPGPFELTLQTGMFF